MYIEVLVFLIILGFVMLWFFFTFITKKIKLWRYKPENDKGKLAEESRRRSGLSTALLPTTPKGFKLLPTEHSDSVGQIKHLIGESSSSTRKLGFFKRR